MKFFLYILLATTFLMGAANATGVRLVEFRQSTVFEMNGKWVWDTSKACVITAEGVFIEKTDYVDGKPNFTVTEKTNITIGGREVEILQEQIAAIDTRARFESGYDMSGPQTTIYEADAYRNGEPINIFYTEPSVWAGSIKTKYRTGTKRLTSILSFACPTL
ncbi:MAG: hypothetical protein AB7F59_03415 [Bdellovibrionales bacterium]